MSQAPSEDADRATGASMRSDDSGSPDMSRRRGQSMGSKELRKQLTMKNTKGFKDKLKVQLLTVSNLSLSSPWNLP